MSQSSIRCCEQAGLTADVGSVERAVVNHGLQPEVVQPSPLLRIDLDLDRLLRASTHLHPLHRLWRRVKHILHLSHDQLVRRFRVFPRREERKRLEEVADERDAVRRKAGVEVAGNGGE